MGGANVERNHYVILTSFHASVTTTILLTGSIKCLNCPFVTLLLDLETYIYSPGVGLMSKGVLLCNIDLIACFNDHSCTYGLLQVLQWSFLTLLFYLQT